MCFVCISYSFVCWCARKKARAEVRAVGLAIERSEMPQKKVAAGMESVPFVDSHSRHCSRLQTQSSIDPKVLLTLQSPWPGRRPGSKS